ncbi:hypothetical protein GCM10010245_92040 [Streptomyces spectabilis]|uniref:Uncharacterized protein n=1 Tax=Streptomyces spectabilis TaxID=68270 RepID=A0A7W8B3K8_STRST|nr:hypothetical protein [Streptomyces spectabilis]GGV58921.1 hypothetical protein GCM10010245_92040 [Streptomyces spectabilis]
MTKKGPTGPKKRARRRQQRTTGTKYTQALRNTPPPTQRPAPAPEPPATTQPLTFQLADLLTACTSGTPAAWEPHDDHIVWGFHSELLARPVPSGTALSPVA